MPFFRKEDLWHIETLLLIEELERLKEKAELEELKKDYVKVTRADLFPLLAPLKKELNLRDEEFERYLTKFKNILRDELGIKYLKKTYAPKLFEQFVKVLKFQKSQPRLYSMMKRKKYRRKPIYTIGEETPTTSQSQ